MCTTHINDTGGKFPPSPAANLPSVSTTPVANLQPVLLVPFTPVVNLPLVSQIVATISDCLHLKVKVKWRQKYIYVLTLLPKVVKKIFKTYLIEDFFRLTLVSMTPAVHLELRISPPIFEKIWNDPNAIFRGLEEDDSWKNLEAKNLLTLSL